MNKFIVTLWLLTIPLSVKAALFTDTREVWQQTGTILVDPVAFDAMEEDKRILAAEAMNIWASNTVVNFDLSPPQNSDPETILIFSDEGGCSTALTGSPQQPTARLGGCDIVEDVVHELGHILGLAHEQNRPDRDFTIDMEFNTLDGQSTIVNGAHSYGPLDIESVMMYTMIYPNEGEQFNTDTVHRPNGDPGASVHDFAAINAYYGTTFKVHNGSEVVESRMLSPVTAAYNGSCGPFYCVFFHKSLESVAVENTALPPGLNINYQTYSPGSGWSSNGSNGQARNGPFENFTAWITGTGSAEYSVEYRIGVATPLTEIATNLYLTQVEWRPWQANGRYASDGFSPQPVVAIQVRFSSNKSIRLSNTTDCIDVYSNDISVIGTNVGLWGCNGGKTEQQIEIQRHNSISSQDLDADGEPESPVQLETLAKTCLVVQNDTFSDGANVVIDECCNENNCAALDLERYWFVDDLNFIRNAQHSDFCLARGASSNIEIADCDFQDEDQMFEVTESQVTGWDSVTEGRY